MTSLTRQWVCGIDGAVVQIGNKLRLQMTSFNFHIMSNLLRPHLPPPQNLRWLRWWIFYLCMELRLGARGFPTGLKENTRHKPTRSTSYLYVFGSNMRACWSGPSGSEQNLWRGDNCYMSWVLEIHEVGTMYSSWFDYHISCCVRLCVSMDHLSNRYASFPVVCNNTISPCWQNYLGQEVSW